MQKPIAFPPENGALLLTREVEHAARVGEHPPGLPIDLLNQSVSRLRVLALLYAFVFFMVEVFPVLLPRQDQVSLLGLLAVDRAASIHGRHTDGAPAPSCADAGDTAVGKDGTAHPFDS